MRKYQASSQSQTTGWGVKAYFEGMHADRYLAIIQMSLDVLSAIEEQQNSSSNYVAMGTGMAELAPMPADVRTIPQALASLNDLYAMSIRNYPPR